MESSRKVFTEENLLLKTILFLGSPCRSKRHEPTEGRAEIPGDSEEESPATLEGWQELNPAHPGSRAEARSEAHRKALALKHTGRGPLEARRSTGRPPERKTPGRLQEGFRKASGRLQEGFRKATGRVQEAPRREPGSRTRKQ